jgi:RES domain-containing protein
VIVYRIADSRRPLFDGMGALINGGRWNTPGHAIIYAAETYAGAMLEVLAHSNLSSVPKHHVCLPIEIPDTLLTEAIDLNSLSGWPKVSEAECRVLGDAWIARQSSAVLRVPSIVSAGHERNILINPSHRDFGKIVPGEAAAVHWDPRLFSGR